MALRLFIGVELPGDVKRLLNDVSSSLKDQVPGARWVRPDNIHLTLKFLGSTPEDKLDDIVAALEGVVEDFRKFYFSLGEVGGFPSKKRARVLWVGVQHGAAELIALSKAIEDALAPLGFEREKREPTPHITIARINQPKSVEQAVAEIDLATCAGRLVNVDSLTIFQSRLKRSGAEYTPLRQISLNP